MAVAAATAATFGAATASAAPEEIQVYMNEMDEPGTFGLDLHNNYVVSGSQLPDYPGAQVSAHRYRLTPEFSFGMTRSIELGAYLPLITVTDPGKLSIEGVKFRVKYLASRSFSENSWWGLNLEVGKVSHALDVNPWNAELKSIVGGRVGQWVLAANVNIDSAVSGPKPGPATLDIDTKIAYDVAMGLQIGLETYSGLGALSHLGNVHHQDQSVFLVADTAIRHFDLNVGVGRGYWGSQDGWVVKAIVGVPIQ